MRRKVIFHVTRRTTTVLGTIKKRAISLCHWRNITVYPLFVFGLLCCILIQYFSSSVVIYKKHIIKYNRPIHVRPSIYRFKQQINTTQENSMPCHGRNFLVYTCQERCGGWGDRQKGIVSAFLLALMTNRSFVVDLQVPCDINIYMNSNLYDWNKCREYVKRVPENDTETIFLGKMVSLIEPLKHENFTESWDKTVIIVKISSYERIIKALRENPKTLKQLSWLKEYANEDVINLILRYLFVPNKSLQQDIMSFIDTSTKKRRKRLVCGHIRIGLNPSNPLDDSIGDEYFTQPRQNAVFSFLKQFNDSSKYVVYLATDSDEVRNHAKSYIPNYINLDRKIVHVDKYSYVNSTESCDGVHTVLFEQYLLTKCDYLVLTRSNFGANAAYIRGHARNLFLYYQRRIEPATSLSDIQRYFVLK